MLVGRLVSPLLKLLLPKVLDHMMQIFKLDKLLSYVEEDNELDHKVKELEKRIMDASSKYSSSKRPSIRLQHEELDNWADDDDSMV